jgi:hypothetical protein
MSHVLLELALILGLPVLGFSVILVHDALEARSDRLARRR